MSSNGLSMDELTLKEILTEQIEENKATRKYITQLEQILANRDQVIKDLIESFEEKSRNLKVVVPKPDLSEVNATLDAKLTSIQQAVEKKPVPVIRQLRFLFFPETNVSQYYKITLGRILPWLFAALFVTYLFFLGKDWLGKWQALREQEFETNVSAKAWDNLYKKASARDRRKLDSYWQKNSKSED